MAEAGISKVLRGGWAAALLLLLAACAHTPARPTVELPPLQLAPSALGHTLSAQQRLHFTFGKHEREMDALLEADADEVRLLVQAMGQVGVRLFWDGKELKQQRAPWLPPQVRAERVLDDLQFVLWPADEIRKALPQQWALREVDSTRELLRDGQIWLSVSETAGGRMRLDNRADGYQLEIESVASEAVP